MDKRVMTIGRQYGSNGRSIAKELAQRLGVHYYDKELIKLAGERSDIPYEELLKVDEKRANPWRYPVEDDMQMENRFRFEPMNDVLFDTEAGIIEELTKKEDCIIIGRCANHILKGRTGCTSVFIHAAFDTRVQNIMKRASIDEKAARNLVKKLDKQRRYYYNYYTDHKWDDMGQYDFCIDSKSVGREQILDILEAIYRAV